MPDIVAALDSAKAAVIHAPAGAGKTTRVPPALIDGATAVDRLIMLEPRRVAARAAARRMADDRHWKLGHEVGYQVRFDRRAGPGTRILVVTEGILVALLQRDPFLDGVDAVVFDEFHERRLDSDLALAMVLRVRSQARPDLKVAVMSATLDPEPVAKLLGGCPIIETALRGHPVDITYRRPGHGLLGKRAAWGGWPPSTIAEEAARGAVEAMAHGDGNGLVFLPGVGEIRATKRRLAAWADQAGVELVALYGDLPPERQDAVLRPSPRRRLVLSTNLAESSVTIEGVTAVVDTGLARRPRYDSGCGLNRLELGPISRASADQRAGRAGRTAPGRCLRLWTRSRQRELMDEEEPEIRRVDLTRLVLELMAWGETDPLSLIWLDPPDGEALAQAEALLRQLGALDSHGVTALGRRMAALPTEPRLARIALEGYRLGHPREAALAAALLGEPEPFQRAWATRDHVTDSDVADRVEVLRRLADGGRLHPGVRQAAARFTLRAATQLSERRGAEPPVPNPTDCSPREATLRAVLAGYPDRVARRRLKGSARALMVGGRGVRLTEWSGVTQAELFVCVDLDAGRRGARAEARVRQASAIELDWLSPDALERRHHLELDPVKGRVVATERLTYHDLVLEERPVPAENPDQVAALLAEAAAEDPAEALDLSREPVSHWLARVRSLAEWMPELDLPSFDRAALIELLPQLCRGRRSLDELRRAPVLETLRQRLTWPQHQALDRHAPERVRVPGGRRVRLVYEPGQPPVLAARIQELFGLTETPRVAAGRVAVLLHLLAPNMRPQQVTDDLASFWRNTYPELRKELRGRYPKHAWPVDPLGPV